MDSLLLKHQYDHYKRETDFSWARPVSYQHQAQLSQPSMNFKKDAGTLSNFVAPLNSLSVLCWGLLIWVIVCVCVCFGFVLVLLFFSSSLQMAPFRMSLPRLCLWAHPLLWQGRIKGPGELWHLSHRGILPWWPVGWCRLLWSTEEHIEVFLPVSLTRMPL